MVLLIPDKVLEKLICDNCDKYLSVEPVKVYSSRKTKCGRCCEKDDGGVVSLYGLLAESSLFKCVNRFDGCKKLLAYRQVKEHERKCVGEKYFCPICTETNKVPTYLLYKHFEEEHNENILKFPTFLVDVDDCCNVRKTFLYKIENNLFFINSEIDFTNGYILLNALQVQKHSKTVNKQKFILNDGKTNIFKTPRKACDSLDSQEFAGFRIELPEIISQSTRVEFEIDTTDSTELIGFSLAEMDPESSQSQPTTSACTDDEESTSPVNTSKLLQPRKIFLNEHFRKSHLHYIVNDTKDGLRSLNFHLEVFLHCFKCREISDCIGDFYRGFFCKPHNYHFICFYCYDIVKSSGISGIIVCDIFVDYDVFKEIEYFCSWKCGTSFNNEEIVLHETTCSHQPPRMCPIGGCYYSATLCQLKHHCQDIHETININRHQYSCQFLTNSRFWFRPLSVHYIWLFNILVRVQIDEFNGNQIPVTISKCGDESDILAFLIFRFEDAQFKILNEGFQWVSILNRPIPALLEPIKCYLEF